MSTHDHEAALDRMTGWDDLPPAAAEARARAAGVVAQLRGDMPTWVEQGRTPVRRVARRLGEAGLLGMLVGSDPADALSYGVVCAELEGLDSGIRTLASVQGSLAMEALDRFGTASAQERWLPALRTGTAVGAFALTEPDAGSDPGAMATSARAVPDGYIIDGHKTWVSNGPDADVVITWVRSEGHVTAFAVPTDAPGVLVSPVPAKASLRGSSTAEISFESVRVDADSRLTGARGIGSALRCLNEARFGIVFGAVGAARDSLLSALSYTLAREQFGRPLAGFQLTQAGFAQATAAVAQGWLLARRLAERHDSGDLRPDEVSLAKYANARMGLEVARSMRELLGANGTLLTHSPIRHAANLESVVTYEGTEQMHALIVGQSLTGIGAFR